MGARDAGRRLWLLRTGCGTGVPAHGDFGAHGDARAHADHRTHPDSCADKHTGTDGHADTRTDAGPITAAASPAELEALMGAPPSSCRPPGGLGREVIIAPAWEPGVVRNLRIRSERDRPAEDAAAGGPATEDVTLTVTNATDSGVDFDWSSDNLAIEGLGSTAFLGPDERELLESVVTPTLQYRLDRFGVLDEVLNLDELQASVLEFARLVAEVDPEAAEFAEFFEQLDSTSLALLFIEKPAVYHFHDETFVDLAQPIVFDDFLPNALGGEAFPAVTSVEVIASQPDDDCLVIITTTEPDPEQFAEILLATVENVFGTVPDEGLDTGEWRIVTTNVARVDAVTGLLSSSVTDQTVTVDGVEAGERLIIVDVTESLTE